MKTGGLDDNQADGQVPQQPTHEHHHVEHRHQHQQGLLLHLGWPDSLVSDDVLHLLGDGGGGGDGGQVHDVQYEGLASCMIQSCLYYHIIQQQLPTTL